MTNTLNKICYGCLELNDNCNGQELKHFTNCIYKKIKVVNCECGNELSKGGFTAYKASEAGRAAGFKYFCPECRTRTNGIEIIKKH